MNPVHPLHDNQMRKMSLLAAAFHSYHRAKIVSVAVLGSVVFATGGGFNHLALAQDDSQETEQVEAVFTHPPTDDISFELQGEFLGEIAATVDAISTEQGDSSVTPPVALDTKLLGLQLRAMGGENFEGLSFYGGLPGESSHQSTPMKLVGRRSGDFLVLSGGPWAIFVDKAGCNLMDQSGKLLGRLGRIERKSLTLGASAPQNAIILFDGSGMEQFQKGKVTEEGLLEEGADIKPMIQDFDLHVEFQLPYMPNQDGQSRANSGIYIMSRYECQILDSFAQEAVNNGCGAIYLFKSPDVNMCLPPLVWQTYDLRFTAPRWAADKSKLRNAHITTWLNGVKIQDDVNVPSSTGHGKPEEPTLLPTILQNHDCPVRFRNAWIIDRGLITVGEFPILATLELNSEEPTKEVDTTNPEPEKKSEEKTETPGAEPPTK